VWGEALRNSPQERKMAKDIPQTTRTAKENEDRDYQPLEALGLLKESYR